MVLSSSFSRSYHAPKRFHYYASFVVDTPDKVIPRSFPHSIGIFPHRILKFERSTLGFGPTGECERPKSRKERSIATSGKSVSGSGRKTRSGSRQSSTRGSISAKSEDDLKKDFKNKNETDDVRGGKLVFIMYAVILILFVPHFP